MENIGFDNYLFSKIFTFFKDCNTIQDWCGKDESLKNYFLLEKSKNPNIQDKLITNINTDLKYYKSNTEGIFMHNILENNYDWDIILNNACKSFKKFFCLVITSGNFSEKTQVIKYNKVDGKDVPNITFKLEDILRNLTENNCKYDFEIINGNNNEKKNIIFYIRKKYNIAYYTGFMGSISNESFQIPPTPSDIYDCYYYTNNPLMYEKLKNTKWIRKFLDLELSDDWNTSNFQCKHVKACPHSYEDLVKYDYTIWLDSKLGKLNEKKLLKLINNRMNNNDTDMILRKHPYHGPDIWYEIDLTLKQERYRKISDQIHTYVNKQLNLGFSAHTSFHVCCGFIIRKMNENTKNIGEEWYKNIEEAGIQDQIPFFFIKQKFKGIAPLDDDIIKTKNTYDF